MKTKLLYSFLAIALIISSCGNDGDNDDQPDPCAVPITISFSANTNASNGQSDGSFTASATGAVDMSIALTEPISSRLEYFQT